MEVKTQWPGAGAVKQDDRSSGSVPETRAGLSRHPSFDAQTIDADIGFGLPLTTPNYARPPPGSASRLKLRVVISELSRTQCINGLFGIAGSANWSLRQANYDGYAGQTVDPKTWIAGQVFLAGITGIPVLESNRHARSDEETGRPRPRQRRSLRGDCVANPVATDLKTDVAGCYYFLVVTVDFSTVTGTAGCAGAAVAGSTGATAGSTAVGALLLSADLGAEDFTVTA